MKSGTPEMIEGPEAFTRFKNAMKAVLAVPHSEIKKRIEEHRKQAALNPNRRGPKRKANPSASRARAR
jgi:hypothetical protein